jgi:hypothetical protein
VTVPLREALSGLLLLALLAGALFVAPETPGPGPLALATGLAALHGALLSPLVGRGPAPYGFLTLPLALPAVAAASYGHAGAMPLLGSLLLVAFAACSGVAARALGPARTGLYGPTIVLLFVMPEALEYLVVQFGDRASAAGWLAPSPWRAAESAAKGALPLAALLALAAWPVYAIARRAR